MYSSKLTRLLAGAGLAVLLTAAFSGCSADPDNRVEAGSSVLLDKIMPGRYSQMVVSRDSCLLYLNRPSFLEELREIISSPGSDSNALYGFLPVGEDTWWDIRAHKEGAHWVIDGYTVDPKATSPARVATVIQQCVAEAEASVQKDAEAAKEAADRAKETVAGEARKADAARKTAASWQAAASGVLEMPAGTTNP
jgi:hypothetical protein